MWGFSKTNLYVLNGVAMTLIFFIVRVVYYTWVIFIKLPTVGRVLDAQMWSKLSIEDPVKHRLLQLSVVLYMLLWLL